MALQEFEKQFASKLKSREISPSDGSWVKLEKILGEKQQKRHFPIWIGMAASILIGIVLLGVFFSKNRVPTSSEIVNTPAQNVKKETSPVLESKRAYSFNNMVRNSEEKTPSKTQKKSEKALDPVKPTEIQIAGTQSFQKKEILNSLESSLQDQSLPQEKIDYKIAELMAKVSSKDAPRQVSEAELDALLASAAREISAEQLFSNSKAISAQNLLGEVEQELEQSFRAKIFEALKEGFQKTKTALANRNF